MLLDLHQSNGFAPRKQTANEYASACPGCGGNDRFIIFAEKEKYWCRGCGKKGDAIQYLREFRGMSFPDAAREVGKDLSLDRAKGHSTSGRSNKPATTTNTPAPAPKAEQPAAWRETAGRFIAQTTEALHNSPEVLSWLRLERGITQETAAKFRLGWFDHDYWGMNKEWGLPADGRKMFIPSGLVIPWQGKRIRIRRDNPGEYNGKPNKRYLPAKGSDMAPMTIGTAHERTAIIVESDLDAILLSQEIRREVFIVAMGSTSYRPDEALLNDLLSCPVVLVVLDTDEPGAKASTWWLENVPSTYRTLTPATFGKDITAAFLNGLDINEWIGVSMELYAESIGDNFEKAPF